MIKEKKKEIVNTLGSFIKLPSEKDLEELKKKLKKINNKKTVNMAVFFIIKIDIKRKIYYYNSNSGGKWRKVGDKNANW